MKYLERKELSLLVDRRCSETLDLNSEACPCDDNSDYDMMTTSIGDSISMNHAKGKYLIAEDVASSANQDPLCSYRCYNQPKARDTLKCGTTNHLEEKDALRKWKEIKRNGFMTPVYIGIPAASTPRARKRKQDVLQQKMEQAKKEQVDRFTKIAAPSGLLNGLNPGIINHVRNSKQVHSIFQSLVRSKKEESHRLADMETSTEQEKMNLFGVNESVSSCEVATFRRKPQNSENHLLNSSSTFLSSENIGGCRNMAIEEGRVCSKPYVENRSKDDVLELKLSSSSSSSMASGNTSCLSNEDLTNVNIVDNLSFKAASVVSLWLQLLQEDIKGRLAALHRSKERVRAVIRTELPCLMSKEFSSSLRNDTSFRKDPAFDCSNKVSAELHQEKWSKLFNLMDINLSEEEKQLECWLNRVNKMLLHCDEGLQHVHAKKVFEMQHLGTFTDGFRSKDRDQEKDISVIAAAASIYSTCNFISSRENVNCY